MEFSTKVKNTINNQIDKLSNVNFKNKLMMIKNTINTCIDTLDKYYQGKIKHLTDKHEIEIKYHMKRYDALDEMLRAYNFHLSDEEKEKRRKKEWNLVNKYSDEDNVIIKFSVKERNENGEEYKIFAEYRGEQVGSLTFILQDKVRFIDNLNDLLEYQEKNKKENIIYISWISVKQEYQNKGIAKMIYRRFAEIYIDMFNGSEINREFISDYARRGWNSVAREYGLEHLLHLNEIQPKNKKQ